MLGKKVLLIDDNRDLIDCLGFILQDAGIEVCKAYCLAEAHAALAQNTFDLLFLDIRLPDGNGLGLYYQLKLQSPGLRIVVMTGYRLEQVLNDVNGRLLQVVTRSFTPERAAAALAELAPQDTVLFHDKDYLPYILAREDIDVVVCREFSAVADLPGSSADAFALHTSGPVIDLLALAYILRTGGVRQPLLLFVDHPPEAVVRSGRFLQTTNGCIFKPFDPQDFLEDVEAALGMVAGAVVR